jgi:CO dehydrogenase maturation factor
MRIAFCGKGGSGKSTLSSLTARYLAHLNKPVLVVDGDINQHLGHALGFSEEELAQQPKLGMDTELFYNTIKGDNVRLPSLDYLTESTPAARGSGLLSFNQPSPVFDYYERYKNGMRLLAVGGHDDEKVGATCYHTFTGAFGIFLNHFIDGQGEYVIGDMCAGADPFASSGLASRFDAVFLVVEPTLKSTGVYTQCKQYAEPFGIKIFVIGNKIENQGDKDFIANIVGDDLVGFFEKSDYVRNLEKGMFDPIDQLEAPNKALLEKVIALTDSLQRDWKQYQDVGVKFHKQAAEGWANAMFGLDIMDQVDPEFSYDDVIAQMRTQEAA